MGEMISPLHSTNPLPLLLEKLSLPGAIPAVLFTCLQVVQRPCLFPVTPRVYIWSLVHSIAIPVVLLNIG